MKTKLALAALLSAGVLNAYDMVISPAQLPANAQSFLNTHFKGVAVGYAKKDLDSYDVTLTDGTEIDFIINGEWKDVDGKYKPIPLGFLPSTLVNKVKVAQPNAQIIQVEKEINGYKFQFNNNMEVYSDFNGNILGQKWDD